MRFQICDKTKLVKPRYCCTEESGVVKVITQTALERFELHKPLFNSRGDVHLCVCVYMCVSQAATVHSARGSLSVTQSLQSALA